MAVSNVLNNKPEAPAAPVAQGKTAAQTAAKAKNQEFAASGKSERAMMSDDQKQAEGSKSDKIAFVCPLGNPAVKQARTEKNQGIPSYQIVGYKFKALEDVQVPVAPYKENYTSLTDVDAVSYKKVNAGETFDLNIVETGILISEIPYAGQFTGEGTDVYITVKHSLDRPDPLPVLCKRGGGSIKANIELIADMIEDGSKNGHPQVKPEYAEKFAVLFKKREARKKAAKEGKAAVTGESAANIAAAFRKFYASK